MSEARVIKLPRYVGGDLWMLLANIEEELLREHKDVADESLMRLKLRALFDKRPELLMRDQMANEVIRAWKRRHTAALNESHRKGQIYRPQILIPIGNGKRHKMQTASAADLTEWGKVEARAISGAQHIITRVNERNIYRLERVPALMKNPKLTLGQIEMKVFGYEPKPDDDKPIILTPEIDDEVEE